MDKIKDIFDSILCLTAEGPEFHTKLELMDAIRKGMPIKPLQIEPYQSNLA